MAFVHPHVSGVTHFFTVRLARPGTALLIDEVGLLRNAVRDVLRKRPFHIDAFVVLPDHLHAVWTLPDADPNYSERWGNLKAHFSRHLRRSGRAPLPVLDGLSPREIARGAAGIWTPGFGSEPVRDAQDYHARIAACHADPVRHGLAERAQDWPFSSLHRDRRLAGHDGMLGVICEPRPAQPSLFPALP